VPSRRRRQLNPALPIASKIPLASILVFSQDFRGSVTGQVIDASGGAIPNALVKITNDATNAIKQARTNQSGKLYDSIPGSRSSVALRNRTSGDNDGMPRRHTPRNPLFSHRPFPDDVITLCVRWYLRFKLSYRDVAEIAWEIGVLVATSTYKF
jgi:hypothetical protein